MAPNVHDKLLQRVELMQKYIRIHNQAENHIHS